MLLTIDNLNHLGGKENAVFFMDLVMTNDIEKNRLKRIYRDDLDGLRAIAVVFVIFYHLSIWPFTGGFIGVDIFFVISGYLITGGILQQKKNNTFSFLDFYDRRIRRLLPALLFTLLTTYLTAFFIFSPQDFAKFSASTFFSVVGLSNYYFWSSSSYFDLTAIQKPLLHTWSLSVEFQFYLIWPAILILANKNRDIFFKSIVVIITIIGFLISIFAINYDTSGAYYLTQNRFYEFLIGSLIFILRQKDFPLKVKKWNNYLFLLGVGLIIYSAFSFSTKTSFPGWSALVPCVGAALFVLTGDHTKFSYLFCIKPVKYVGEISYSLYLVHWPLIVFLNYLLAREISVVEKVVLLVCCFILASLMHRFVELPLRKNRKGSLSPKYILASCGFMALFISTISISSWLNNGWIWRLPKDIRKINVVDNKASEEYIWKKHNEISSNNSFYNNGKPKLIIIGDSQSADIINILNESGKIHDFDIIVKTVFTQCGTVYVPPEKRKTYFLKDNIGTIGRKDLISDCNAQMNSVMDKTALANADLIFISMRWQPDSVTPLKNFLPLLRKTTNAKIYLFGNKILSRSSLGFIDFYGKTDGVESYASKFRDAKYEHVNALIRAIPSVNFVDMMSLICPATDKCHVLTSDGKPVFLDPSHLTKDGAKYLSHDFENIISKN